jgi:Helix-turn-helix family
MHRARHMWTLFEPLHAVTYFAPEAREHFEAAGLRGYWRGYFAGRAAPLGAVGAPPVIASFFGFAPAMVHRALPDVWSRATPEQALEARLTGARAALTRLLDGINPHLVDAAAEMLAEVAAYADTDGRVLAAANAALGVPGDGLGKLWQAATVLREHRGDGHVAALVVHGLDGCEAQAWRSGLDLKRERVQPARGWTDEDWQLAVVRLAERGWLTPEGGSTTIGVDAHREIEAMTDRAAMRPWLAVGEQTTARLIEALTPLARAAYQGVPAGNPIGMPRPPEPTS